MTLAVFGFNALWSPFFFLLILSVTVVYLLLTTKYRHVFKTSKPLTKKQGFLFIISMLLLYIMKGSPIDLLAHFMFSVHMTQMAIMLFVIPPFLIIGIPDWIWRSLLNIKMFAVIFSYCTHPLIALLLFNGLFSFYHIPFIFDHVMQNRWLHVSSSILLFISAIFMWWPLINDIPEGQSLSGIKKVAYIFAGGMLLTPACALIIFANSPIYATYSDPTAWGTAMRLCIGNSTFSNLNLSRSQLFSSMSLLHDQQLGGVLMKAIQEIIFGIVLGHVFFEWYRKENEESERKINQSLNPTHIKPSP